MKLVIVEHSNGGVRSRIVMRGMGDVLRSNAENGNGMVSFCAVGRSNGDLLCGTARAMYCEVTLCLGNVKFGAAMARSRAVVRWLCYVGRRKAEHRLGGVEFGGALQWAK